MGPADPAISFLCGFCSHVIKAPSASEGRPGRCPRCQQVVVVPKIAVEETARSFPSFEFDESPAPRQLHGLFRGVAVSLAFHAVLLSILGLIIIQSKDLGRSLIVTLFFEAEGSKVEDEEVPVEMPAPIPAATEGNAAVAAQTHSIESNSAGETASSEVAVTGGNRERRISPTVVTTGSLDPLARFSPKVVERLARQPSARQGDYELALFWDGPSDLDLHVAFESRSGSTKRYINYSQKGAPETGFLDVDQNFKVPFVDDPIEHVRWNSKSPPSGTYTVLVHGYKLRMHDPAAPGGARSVVSGVERFTVEIKTPQGVKSFSDEVGSGVFKEVFILEIGGPARVDAEGAPISPSQQLLETAKKKLTSQNRTTVRSGVSLLKSLVRRFPMSEAATEARALIKQHE